MRVITYNDPRCIEEIEGWNELKKLPHFCISQTLVQGLSQKCGREEFNMLSTIDKLLNEFYSEWKNNSELSLKQYLDLVEEIKKIKNEKYKNVFYKNKNELLKSIRLLIESDVSFVDLKNDRISDELKLFFELYGNLKGRENWNSIKYAKDKGEEALKLAFNSIFMLDIKKEINRISGYEEQDISSIEEAKLLYEKINSELNKKHNVKKTFLSKNLRNNKSEDSISIDRIKKYIECIEELDNKKIDKIIFHGVHQFSPLIIRFIKQMEMNGIEIIFLFQYEEKFKEIYSTWENVYKWTGVKFEKNKVKNNKYCKLVGKNYANLLLGKVDEILDSKTQCIKFDNLTEFSNYVAQIYNDAKDSIKSSHKRKDVILAKMSEQFYSVNGEEVNEILSIYFPEQFGEKHFLSYPIGQFILGLYSMWDHNSKKIKIDNIVLKECLSINLWFRDKEITPLELHEKLSPYFIGIEDIEDYIENIKLIKKYIFNLNLDKNIKEKEYYDLLSFFSLSVEEIELYEIIINDLKNISEKLFKNKEKIMIKKQYIELLEIIKEKISITDGVSKREYKLVEDIFNRLSDDTNEIISSVEEVKSTLNFYLSQKRDDTSSNWIVRDFQQIDGAIFLADEDSKERHFNKKSIYHYVEVSDNNINSPKKIELPWPLRDNLFNTGNDIVDIYMNSRSEYSNFLKCTLFYGMYYLDRDIKISYIENINSDSKESLYFPLKLIKLNEQEYTIKEIQGLYNLEEKYREAKMTIDEKKLCQNKLVMMDFCPRRYFYEGLNEIKGCYSNDFLCRMYLRTILGIKILEDLKDTDKSFSTIEKVINKRIKNAIKLIPAWERDINDMKAYLIRNTNRFKNITLDKSYIEIKKNFINKKFFINENESVDIRKCEDIYSKNKNIQRIKDYIKYDKIDEEQKCRIEEKCKYCKYRDICTEVYKESVD